MNKGLSMLIAALLLGGCGHWQSGPDAPFVRWKCQSQQNIAWRYADDQPHCRVCRQECRHQQSGCSQWREPVGYGCRQLHGGGHGHDNQQQQRQT